MPAHEASGQHYGVNSKIPQLFCYLNQLLGLLSAPEAVTCVEFCENRNLAFACLHRLAYAHAHKTHPVLETSSEHVPAMVCIW